jgi:ubiquinone/menaquinone biosynthesis C-methylase UbiE
VDTPVKLNCGSGKNPLEGFVNLDATGGWRFQDELEYRNVEAITISHSLMFLREIEIENFLREAYKVLKPGGVIRITEDYSIYEGSKVFGGWRGSRILLGPILLTRLLKKTGFKVFFDNYYEYMSQFKDHSLIQRFHGGWPRVFHIEGVK